MANLIKRYGKSRAPERKPRKCTERVRERGKRDRGRKYRISNKKGGKKTLSLSTVLREREKRIISIRTQTFSIKHFNQMHFPRRHTHNPNIFFFLFFFQSEFMYLARVSPSPLFCDDKRLRLARGRRKRRHPNTETRYPLYIQTRGANFYYIGIRLREKKSVAGSLSTTTTRSSASELRLDSWETRAAEAPL